MAQTPHDPNSGNSSGTPHAPNVTVELELITPEMAAEILERSQFNRAISDKIVNQYARALAELRWFFTGESIIFDGDSLLDGHHRVKAVIVSRKPTWFIVVRGVQKDAFHFIDHGRPRAFKDTLYILGNPKNQFVASATSYLAGYMKFKYFTTHGLEEHERWNTYESNPELDQMQALYSRSLPLKGVPPALLLAAHIVLAKISSTDAADFMELVVEGNGLDEDDPAQAFRKYVKKIYDLDRKPSGYQTKIGNALITAWNLYRKGKRTAKLRIPSVCPDPV
jgi:hypothetical protein